MDPLCLVLIALGDDLEKCQLTIDNIQPKVQFTSIISSRGNSRNGMSAALQAMR